MGAQSAQPVLATTPSVRLVLVQAHSCRHRWTLRTRRTNTQIEGGNVECPTCRPVAGRNKAFRRVVVLESDRHCAACRCPLHHLHDPDDILCGPCEEKRKAKAIALASRSIEDAKAAERDAVLAVLPGTLPEIVIQLAGMRYAWIITQRVLDEAKRAGDVVEWNVPGCRPVYRLVRPLPEDEPEDESKSNAAHNPWRKGPHPRTSDEEFLAALPATSLELAARFGYTCYSTTANRMQRLKREGRVWYEGIPGRPFVWHRVET